MLRATPLVVQLLGRRKEWNRKLVVKLSGRRVEGPRGRGGGRPHEPDGMHLNTRERQWRSE